MLLNPDERPSPLLLMPPRMSQVLLVACMLREVDTSTLMIDGQQKSKHSTPPCVSETLDPAACSNTFKALNQEVGSGWA